MTLGTLRKTRGVVSLLGLAAAAMLGCKKAGPAGGGFQMPPTPVETAEARTQEVRDTFEAVGTIEASDAIVVVAQMEGTIVRLPFVEGGRVKAGDVLCWIDDRELAAEAARAEAVRDQQKIVFERTQRIVFQKVGSQQNLDDAAAALKVAEANLTLAETRLAKARIVAPFAGLVGGRRVSPGAYVRQGDPITELTSIDEVKVSFFAPERYLATLVAGTPVQIRAAAVPGDTVAGKVDLVEPVVDPATRNVRIVARVTNAQWKLRAGMSADVTAVLASRPAAITIASEAVFAEGDQLLVYVVKDGKAVRTAVKLGTRLPDVVEVLDGLSPGTVVVRAGHQKLFDGAAVAPVGKGPAGSPAGAEGGKTEGDHAAQ